MDDNLFCINNETCGRKTMIVKPFELIFMNRKHTLIKISYKHRKRTTCNKLKRNIIFG